MDGRPRRTAFHPGFEEEFPDVELVPGVFVADGPFLTASGGYAAADLILHMIARDHGEDLAQIVSDQMVYNAVRKGTAEQRFSFQARSGMRAPKLAKAVSVMLEALDNPVSTAEIAAEAGLSTRQLERLFGKYLQTAPKKYLMKLRLDRARQLLIRIEMSVIDLSTVCGFASSSHFSWAYRNLFGVQTAEQKGVMTSSRSAFYGGAVISNGLTGQKEQTATSSRPQRRDMIECLN